LFWLYLPAQQAFDARLEIAILGGVEERVDTAAHKHQYRAEVVERARVVFSVADDVYE